MFFGNKRRFEVLGVCGYSEYFVEAQEYMVLGEVTPGYLWVSRLYGKWGGPPAFANETPQRTKDILGGNVKLVVLLRNPIDRACSAFLHHRRHGKFSNVTDRMRDYWRGHGIVHLGFYGAHLSEWAKVFPKENFFICTYEEFFSSSHKLRELQHFLEVELIDGKKTMGVRVHADKGGYRRGEHGVVDTNDLSIATAEDMELLRDTYVPDVQALADQWDIDVSAWRSDFPGVA
jgi:hypothetical protein